MKDTEAKKNTGDMKDTGSVKDTKDTEDMKDEEQIEGHQSRAESRKPSQTVSFSNPLTYIKSYLF